jgi:hypothetical protein
VEEIAKGERGHTETLDQERVKLRVSLLHGQIFRWQQIGSAVSRLEDVVVGILAESVIRPGKSTYEKFLPSIPFTIGLLPVGIRC